AIHRSSPRTKWPNTAISPTLMKMPAVASTPGHADRRLDLVPPGGQATLGQDQYQRPEAERVGQAGVVELQPQHRVAHQHAEAEEEQQRGETDPGAEPGGDDRRDHHDGPDQQDSVEIDLHWLILPDSQNRDVLGSVRGRPAAARGAGWGREGPASRKGRGLPRAVAAGFEPAEAFTSRAFEARSLGRSDTPPPQSVPNQPG